MAMLGDNCKDLSWVEETREFVIVEDWCDSNWKEIRQKRSHQFKLFYSLRFHHSIKTNPIHKMQFYMQLCMAKHCS